MASHSKWTIADYVLNHVILLSSNIRRTLCFNSCMSGVPAEQWGVPGRVWLCGTGQFLYETRSNVRILVHFKEYLLIECFYPCSGGRWALCVSRGRCGCHRSRWGWLVDGEKKWPYWIGPRLLPCQRMSLPDSHRHVIFCKGFAISNWLIIWSYLLFIFVLHASLWVGFDPL